MCRATRLRNINAAKNANGPTVDEENGNLRPAAPCAAKATIKDPSGVPCITSESRKNQLDPVALKFATQMIFPQD
jgi:hypothetical protein